MAQTIRSVETLWDELVKASQKWAGGGTDLNRVGELRHEILLSNHVYYLKNIPAYQKLAYGAGIGQDADIEAIKTHLTFSDGIFKSYRQEWLDNHDFSSMNRWLSEIHHQRLETQVPGISTIDTWADSLADASIKLVFSSGTSGTFSFVPRSTADWIKARDVNMLYLAQMLAARLSLSSLRFLAKSMPAAALVQFVGKSGLPDFDGVFLGFRQGRMGNQVLIPELASLFKRQSYLYEIEMPAEVLRLLFRGTGDEKERAVIQELQNTISGAGKEENYSRIIQSMMVSTKSGQKVFIFGAPYQLMELCEIATNKWPRLSLKKGSLVLFGGGWKSFNGEAVERENLINMMSRTFGLPPEMVLEGYSMTEISVLMLRCASGRFHIPPVIEPVIYDEELNPVAGRDISGRFGFLDPLAVSYPGFIISSDFVHMVDSECACGLHGPAIINISRAHGQEVKGCGGIMSSIRA